MAQKVPKFKKNVHFLKTCFSNGMYVGRVSGETTLHFMEILWENEHFFEIWGPFEPFLAI